MKARLTLATGLIVLAGILIAATARKEAPPPTKQVAPLTSTEADPSVTDPEPAGSIGTALVVECNQGVCHEFEYGNGLTRIDGHGVEWWRWEALKAEKRIDRLERRLQKRWEPTVDYAIRLASVVYGVPYRELYAVASCESGLSPFAKNRNSTASGLFQMLYPSTWFGKWGAKPFADAGFSVWDPVAQALAAARMVVNDGGWRQWACQPR